MSKEKERYKYFVETNQLYDSEEDKLYAYNLNNNKIISTLNQQDQKIKDLEAKLAESEKQIKDAREARDMAVDSWCKNRRKYEAQIAEMQNKSFILYSMLYETLEKQGCEDIASQIDQMTGWTYDKEADWFKGNRNYDQLKQQLAEKDEQIKELEIAFELCYVKMLYITKEYTNLSAIPSKEHFKQQAKEMLKNESK